MLQANSVSVVKVEDIVFTGTLNGTKVLTGVLSPRETQVSLLFQDENGDPLQLPPGTLPVRALFLPLVPIESEDLTDTFFSFALYDNVNLNNMYVPWSSYNDCDGKRMNAKMMLDLVNLGSTAAAFAPYPYVGMAMGGLSPVTSGTVQIYLFYI